jgi:hypothetical protein
MENESGFWCRVCGGRHEELPLSYSVKAPLAVRAIPAEEMESRLVITPDQCVIDGRDFYLRGRIPVPMTWLEEPFIWGVWVEVSPKTFIRSNEMWAVEGREREPAFQGWLNTEIPLYGDTINLEVSVQTQRVGERPRFTVVDQAHPLAIEQRDGISLRRLEEIAEAMLHGVGGNE